MKKLEFYQIDTFTDELFKGNPAGVCPLTEWLDKDVMQAIAFENNLSETAFYVKTGNTFEIRWFTTTTEVDLCGHATLASAYVEFNIKKNTNKKIIFNSKSGELSVSKKNDLLSLDFPVDKYSEINLNSEFTEPFKIKPLKAYKAGSDIMLVFESETTIKNMNPSLEKIKQINSRGITVTSKGNSSDFVSRFFGPQSGIDEDPVTGSTHTYLTPYWSKILRKKSMKALQLSKRGGMLTCKLNEERVEISGNAILYLEGKITIANNV